MSTASVSTYFTAPTHFTTPLDNHDALLENPTHCRLRPNRKPASKPRKSKLLTITRIFTRDLLMLFILVPLILFVQNLYEKNDVVNSRDGIAFTSADFVGKFAEIDYSAKKTAAIIQVQLDAIDRKLEKYVGSLKEEIERRDVRISEKLGEVSEGLEKGLGERLEQFLSKEESEGFVDNYLEDLRVYAREIVKREIEKHAADGLGRVDFALASGGGRVLRHSEAVGERARAGEGWISRISRSVHPDAKKMLTPSFGEPGECFALRGSSGNVTIRLRNAVVVEAITLEHVAAGAAHDRSTAPKDCRVSGWQSKEEDWADVNAESDQMLLPSQFTYDLEKSNAQTFKVSDSVGSSAVDTVKFDFATNHGSAFCTCLYRLRIHGHEPSPSMLAAER